MPFFYNKRNNICQDRLGTSIVKQLLKRRRFLQAAQQEALARIPAPTSGKTGSITSFISFNCWDVAQCMIETACAFKFWNMFALLKSAAWNQAR